MSDPPPRASALRATLPPAVDDVLAAGLAKLPSDRPDTLLDFVAALEAALATGAPVGRLGPPAPPVELRTAPPTPATIEAADASTVVPPPPEVVTTAAAITTGAPTEALTAPAAVAPAAEPVVLDDDPGASTAVHARSGAHTLPDQRRPWDPDAPAPPAEPPASEPGPCPCPSPSLSS